MAMRSYSNTSRIFSKSNEPLILKSTTIAPFKIATAFNHQTPNFTTGDIMLYILLGFVFLCGTFGNMFTIYGFGFTKKRSQAGTGFIIALAVTDFFASIVIPFDSMTWLTLQAIHPNTIPPWPFGVVACYLMPSFNTLFMTASAWLLTAISFERSR